MLFYLDAGSSETSSQSFALLPSPDFLFFIFIFYNRGLHVGAALVNRGFDLVKVILSRPVLCRIILLTDFIDVVISG